MASTARTLSRSQKSLKILVSPSALTTIWSVEAFASVPGLGSIPGAAWVLAQFYTPKTGLGL